MFGRAFDPFFCADPRPIHSTVARVQPFTMKENMSQGILNAFLIHSINKEIFVFVNIWFI